MMKGIKIIKNSTCVSWNLPGIVSHGCNSIENALFMLCGQPSFITCMHNHWSCKIFWKFNLSQGCRLVYPCIMQTVGTLWPSVFVVWWILNSVSLPLLAKVWCISLWGHFAALVPFSLVTEPPPPPPPTPTLPVAIWNPVSHIKDNLTHTCTAHHST